MGYTAKNKNKTDKALFFVTTNELMSFLGCSLYNAETQVIK
jgi:hypothetical protein